MVELICEVTKTEKGKYYNFFVVCNDGTRVQIKPRWENQLVDLHLNAKIVEKEVIK